MRRLYILKKLSLLISFVFLFKLTSLGCSFTLELYDSCGDGWSGAKLTLAINGTAIFTDITLNDGYGPAIYTFYANTGDEITTIYTTGTWANEPWYEIKDPEGNIIGIDGDGGSIPEGISTPIIINYVYHDLDASITEINTNNYAGTNNVYVSLLNNGNHILTSTTIHWEVDGKTQTSYHWTGSLSKCEFEEDLLLGDYTFESGVSYQVKAWSSYPNESLDEYHVNDTVILDLDISPDMSINSLTSFTKDTAIIVPGYTHAQIFGINICTDNYSNPLTMDSIKLNTIGSDDFTKDVNNIKIYSTENLSNYRPSNLIWEGTDISSAIYINDRIKEGDNYYWIAVDVSLTASIENNIQMGCDYLIVNDTKYIPSIIVPYGKRTIKEKTNYYNFMPASIVVGQPDFYTQNTSLDEYTGTGSNNSAVSSKGLLAVGSQSSGRILIWNHIPDTNGAPADIVIGSPDFNTSNSGPSNAYMKNVEGLCFSPDGEKLIASDGINNRVLIWNTIPVTNAQPADVVIGQTNFTSNTEGIAADKLNHPTGVMVTSNGKLIITDCNNNRVLIFDHIPTENGEAADIVIGQENFNSNSSGLAANKLDGPWSTDLSLDGELIISDRLNNRVLIFHKIPQQNGAYADVVIGQSNFVSDSYGVTDSKMSIPLGVTVSPKGELAIGDFLNNRVLIYNEIPQTNAVHANHVLGQPNFNSNTKFNGGISEKSMYHPYGINFDLNGRLFVNGSDMHRVMIYGDLPLDTTDLELTLDVDKTNPHIGESINYTYTITNKGPKSSNNIVIKSALPNLIELDNYVIDKGSYKPYGGTWKVPFLSSGESISLTLNGTIQSEEDDITAYSNIVASSAIDTNMSNNAASLSISVINEAPSISEIANKTIDQATSTEWIPFTIGDVDTDISDIKVAALSSNQIMVPDANILLNGSDKNRYLKVTPATNLSGTTNIKVSASDGYNESSSTFELTILSNNANLTNIDTSETTIEGFRTDSLTYTCELQAGAISAPKVTAISEHTNAFVNIYETDTIPGITTVEVTAENGKTMKTYFITFVLPTNSSDDTTLIDLQVDGYTIDGFSPINYRYTIDLPYGSVAKPVLTAIAKNPLATVSFDQNQFPFPNNDTIEIISENGLYQGLYVVSYNVNTPSDNNNLKQITVDGSEIVTFNPDVLEYTIPYSYGTIDVPTVTGTTEDPNASITQNNASSMPGTTTLDVYAEDGAIKTYNIDFTVAAPSSDASLLDLNVDELAILGFDPAITDYDIELDLAVSEIPEITAATNHASAIVNITDAANIPGTTSILVTAQDGITKLTYRVNFLYRTLSSNSLLCDLKVDGITMTGFDPEVLHYTIKYQKDVKTPPLLNATVYDSKSSLDIINAEKIPGISTITVTAEDGSITKYEINIIYFSNDASLSDIKVNETSISEFDANNLSYEVELSYGTTDIPTLTATTNDENAKFVVNNISTLPGTATILVTAEDGETTNSYEVNFTIADPNTDASLSNLLVDGTSISEFSSTTLTYHVELAPGATNIPKVTATATDENAKITITNTEELPGTTTILVTAEDGETTNSYEVIFYITDPNTDASLSDLRIEGTSISGFSPTILTYHVELAKESDYIPEVTATATDEKANITITDALDLPGTTTVLVTAEDETTTKTYSVHFIVTTNTEEFNVERNLRMFPNPTNGIVHLLCDSEMINKLKVEVFNALGSLMYTNEFENINQSIIKLDLSKLSKGIYFVKLTAHSETFVNSLIIR